MGTSLFRVLILYLVVRAFCAPIALRTQAVGSALGRGFVLRVCTWPVQKHCLAATELCQTLDDTDQPALGWSVHQPSEIGDTPAIPSWFANPGPLPGAVHDRSAARLRC